MQIVERTSHRLVLLHRQRLLGFVLALFTLLCAATTGMIVVFGLHGLVLHFEAWRLLTLIGWGALGCLLTGLGAAAWAAPGRGLTCTFDREAAIVTIRQPALLRMQEQQHSIYGVLYLDFQQNAEGRSVAVYVVLRSGQRIPLGSVPHYESENIRHIAKTVREFLQQAGPAAGG